MYELRLTNTHNTRPRTTIHSNPMSQDYWEARYQTGDMPWEKGAPSPGLVDFLAAHPDLPRGDGVRARLRHGP